ncbi:uncharacterized protein SCHCODRAFT_02667603 [Schizophyllum commune H4-8]|nr:uncharacterized protein SCHCODRAFT_02667603 [Schizophyllum commune H4-8]KAI5892066.1 hypothetical protein SCHCODRAFT_02667603 [Schizophyllum commune H4-8]
MQSNKDSDAPSRSEEYYIEGGDVVVRVENTLFRLHGLHLKRATTFFEDFFTTTAWDAQSRLGLDDGSPLVIEKLKAKDFDTLMWFFYKSAYSWSCSPDATVTPRWERVLQCAEVLRMPQVCKVASHALNCAQALSPLRKIALCAKHGLGDTWAKKEVESVISRRDALTVEEAHSLGIDLAIKLAGAREELLRVPKLRGNCRGVQCSNCRNDMSCEKGIHYCPQTQCHGRRRWTPEDCPLEPALSSAAVRTISSAISLQPALENATSTASLRTFDKGYAHGGDVFFQVQDRLFFCHRYHLCTASPIFEGMFSLPGSDYTEGTSMEAPIKLEHIKASEFQHLLYFFYDSAYEWLPNIDPDSVPMWESILHLADQFVMEEVKAVALYALGHDSAIGSAHKLTLCSRYNVEKTWAQGAFQNLCSRSDPLSDDEMEELPPKVAAAVARAREAFIAHRHAAQHTSVPATKFALDLLRPSLASLDMDPSRVSRSQDFYREDGDFVIRARDTLLRLHGYHLKRATTFFDEDLALASTNPFAPGATDGNPYVLLGVEAMDFQALVWFFYESPYTWIDIPIVDAARVFLWESVLICAEQLQMTQITKVACYALDCAHALSDTRKIYLCAKHHLGNQWVSAELERLISRKERLTYEETDALGPQITMAVHSARQTLSNFPRKPCRAPRCRNCYVIAMCKDGVHFCKYCDVYNQEAESLAKCPKRDSAPFDPEAVKSVVSAMVLSEDDDAPPSYWTPKTRIDTLGGDLFFEVEEQLFSIHSYHLLAVSPVFAMMLELPSGDEHSREGTRDNPIQLRFFKAADFESLLYFFYDSAYDWLPQVDQTMVNTWISILSMADMYDMDKVKAVALYALGRETALGDVRRLAVCLCYGVDKSWAQDAFTRIITRGEFLTDEEVEELIACPKMIGEIGRAQLELLLAAVPRHIPRLLLSKRQRTLWRGPYETIT